MIVDELKPDPYTTTELKPSFAADEGVTEDAARIGAVIVNQPLTISFAEL
jgi:hypothetical protein